MEKMNVGKIIFALLVLVGLTVGSGAVAADSGKAKNEKYKVNVCHKPPGNTDNYQLLNLPQKAAEKHMDRHEHDSYIRSYGEYYVCVGWPDDRR